ncbi:MAG: hypothetical protein ABII09_06615 [Planctomycetota bacterium]
MAANDTQFDAHKSYQKPDILRAKDIIPGSRRSEIENEGGSEIPRFDLARDIMAEHRRLTASRRKSPSSITERVSSIENRESRVGHRAQSIEYTSQWDPIIADIVTRDIERLCGSRS